MFDSNSSPSAHLLNLAVQQVGNQALVLLDAQGIIVGWLAGAERLFGYAADEVIGEDIEVLFTPEDLARKLSAWELETARASGETEDDRWQVRKDGARIWVSGTLTALHNEQGEVQGFAKIIRNRTDQKFQVETLESRITFLQQAEQRKNVFISTLAHELRNPLSALTGAAELLKHTCTGGEDSAFAVGVIERQTAFSARLIDDLLDVARTATGKVEIHKEPVVLQDLLERAVETCRSAIEGRSQDLQSLVPAVPIRFFADPLKLTQVLVNLLQNASKYTEFGGKIWIKATVEGQEAVVRVQDTGVGIPPEIMPHIFGLFTQASPANQSQGGLGIGLSVVKDYVALHGGSVQAASDGRDKGSEFTVRLPLSDLKDEPQPI